MILHTLTTVDHIVLYKLYLISLNSKFQLAGNRITQIICTSFKRNYIPSNFHSLFTLHINAALKQNNICLLMAFFRRTIWLNRS
jgi:hypothetical protein